MILAGDIGGTNVRLILADMHGADLKIIARADFKSCLYDDLLPIIKQFLHDEGGDKLLINAACFAVAGPVQGQQANITNLPWLLDSRELSQHLGCPVRLINDFQGAGYGLEVLQAKDVLVLQEGRHTDGGTRVLLGAGTGLGMATIVHTHAGYSVLPSEGGHTEFAPQDELDLALYHYLYNKIGRVCNEHILSGQGLIRLYEFYRDQPDTSESDIVRQAMTQQDPAAVISDAALQATDPISQQALEHFIKIYGAVAGNLALICLAKGGVYIGGGIAARIASKMQGPGFMQAFHNKGAMQELMHTIPVRLITNTQVGLLGAAHYAKRVTSNE